MRNFIAEIEMISKIHVLPIENKIILSKISWIAMQTNNQ